MSCIFDTHYTVISNYHLHTTTEFLVFVSVFQYTWLMVNHECLLGERINQADFHFLQLTRVRARVCMCGRVCGRACVCICVGGWVCVYSFTINAYSVCNDVWDILEAWGYGSTILCCWVLQPCFFISVSKNVIFHLQRRKLQQPQIGEKTIWYIVLSKT